MAKAYCLIRDQPHYRRDAFMHGWKAAGYDARTGVPQSVRAGDIVCMWNRYGENHELASRVERAGGVVLVAENAYLGPGGVSPHQMEPREWYALAIGGHNGSGTWVSGGPERWDALGVDLKPWRIDGDHILVLPNRSFGRPDLIMPLNWPEDVAKRLRRVTKRPVRIRQHPGNGAPKTSLVDDLRNCWAAAIWSSSAGVQALIAGIPVICEAPRWICKEAAGECIGIVEAPLCDDIRRDAFEEMAWAQWHVNEIATGEPFRRLLLPDSRKAESLAAV